MPARAHISEDIFGRHIQIAITSEQVTGRVYRVWSPATYSPVEENVVPPDDAQFSLTDDEGRALYEALARHYGDYPSNPVDIRADYLHERQRVDKLQDAVIAIAHRRQEKA